MSDVLSQLAAFARLVEPTLDQKTYYELLNLTPQANQPQIRAAYYQVAAQLHPDRYIHMPDREAKEKLEIIYARITEGYRVLSDPKKRESYDEALATGKKRLRLTSRERRGPENPEDGIKHPEAKKFFRLGLNESTRGNWKGAAFNFNLARAYEPDSKAINDRLTQARQKQAESEARAKAEKEKAEKEKAAKAAK